MAQYTYTDIFRNQLIELYGHELKSAALFESNSDIQVVNGKKVKIPVLTVSGYKDHKRNWGSGFNAGSIANSYEDKTLDHDRDIEFGIDPEDVDETNLVVSIANVQARFEKTQAIPELDCYTFSKLYTEAVRVGATIDNTALTTSNILDKLDADMEAFSEAGVPLDRVIMYCTPAVKKLLKKADGITRNISVDGTTGRVDRRVFAIDDIREIVEVPASRLKTAYDFSDGCVAADDAGQINYILVDPEAQVSRQKYSYIRVFTPGTDSRTADNYVLQSRKYNGTFAIDQLAKDGIRMNVTGVTTTTDPDSGAGETTEP